MGSRRHSARRAALALAAALPLNALAQEAAGGAPGALTIDADAAERALERTLVTTGNLLLPEGAVELTTRAAFTRISSQAPVLQVVGDQAFIASSATRRSIVDLSEAFRLGAWRGSQIELEVPYRVVQETRTTTSGGATLANTDESGTGFGDLRLGIARALRSGEQGGANLVGRIEWDSATGTERDDGLSLGGTGYDELEASLAATRRQDPLVFTGRLGYRVAGAKNGLKPGDSVGVSLGALLAASPETSLRLQADQYFIGRAELDGHGIAGSDQVIAMLVLGASSIIGRGEFLDLTLGAGLTDESPDYSLAVSYSMRLP